MLWKVWRKLIKDIRWSDGCEWVNVSSGKVVPAYPGSPGQRDVKRLCAHALATETNCKEDPVFEAVSNFLSVKHC